VLYKGILRFPRKRADKYSANSGHDIQGHIQPSPSSWTVPNVLDFPELSLLQSTLNTNKDWVFLNIVHIQWDLT